MEKDADEEHEDLRAVHDKAQAKEERIFGEMDEAAPNTFGSITVGSRTHEVDKRG